MSDKFYTKWTFVSHYCVNRIFFYKVGYPGKKAGAQSDNEVRQVSVKTL